MEVGQQPAAPEGGMTSPSTEFVSMAQFGTAGMTPEAGPTEAPVEPSADFEGQEAEAPVEERFFEIPDIRDPNRVYKRVSEAKIPEMIQQQDAYIADLHNKIKQYENYVAQMQQPQQQQAPAQQQDSRLDELVSEFEPRLWKRYPNAQPEAIREQAIIQAEAAILAEDRILNAFQRQNAERDMRSFIASNPILTSPLGIQIAERFGVTGQQHLELCNLLKPIMEQQQAQPQTPPQQVVAQRVEQQRQALPPSPGVGKAVTPQHLNPKVTAAFNNWMSSVGKNRPESEQQAMLQTINRTYTEKYGA